jgi:hypothetical protein
MAGWGEIQDGQATVAEQDLGFLVDAPVVGTAIGHEVQGLAEGLDPEGSPTDVA